MLTPEEREFAMRFALPDWMRQRVISAETDKAAIQFLKDRLNWSGYGGPHIPDLQGTLQGIEVRDNRAQELHGILTYREIVDEVRHKKPAQLTLW